MRHVMVMNSKGGCGKSTIATNLASYFASEGYKVALADYDPQRSSLVWLALRPEELPRIAAVPGYDEGLRGVPRDTEVLVIDAPARTHGTEMNELVEARRNHPGAGAALAHRHEGVRAFRCRT